MAESEPPNERSPGDDADVVQVEQRFSDADLRVMPAAQYGLFVLTAAVFGSMLLVIGALLILYWVSLPGTPRFVKGTDMTLELQYYETLNNAALERIKQLFDLIVVRALMPILTAVVGGYIGYQAAKRD